MKTKNIFLTAALIAASITTFAQVGVGTTDPKAALDVVSTDSGFIMPRVADHTTLTVGVDQTGMQVYNTTTNKVMLWTGAAWVASASSADASKWTNDNANTRVALTNLSNGTTARPVGSEFIITDDGALAINTNTLSGSEAITYVTPTGSARNSISLNNSANPTSTANIKLKGGISNAQLYSFGEGYTSNGAFQSNSTVLVHRSGNPGGVPSNGLSIVSQDVNGGDIEFYVGGYATANRKMTIGSNGKVGIGTDTTTPREKLEVNGAIEIKGAVTSFSTASETAVIDRTATNGLRLLSFGDATNRGEISFYQAAENNTSSITSMKIDNKGNVGIGTTTPSAKLDVNGVIKVGENSSIIPQNGMIRYNSTTNKFQGYAAGAWVDLH
jgi:hypothetical protein